MVNYCFSMDRYFGIVFTIKMLLHFKPHTSNILSMLFQIFFELTTTHYAQTQHQIQSEVYTFCVLCESKRVHI